MSNRVIFIRTLVPGIVFLLFWEALSFEDSYRLFFYSAPSKVFLTFLRDVQNIEFWVNIWYTCFAAVLGLFIGTILGSFCGVCFWIRPGLKRVFNPYLTFLGAIPIFAFAPMLIVWFGIGILSKIVMASLSVVLVSLVQAYEGASSVAKTHLIFARTLGVTNRNVLRFIILPGAFRHVLSGLKLNIGFSIMGTFIAEFISSEHGIGHYILKAGGTYDTPRVFVGILTLGLISLLGQGLIELLGPKNRSVIN